MVGRMDGEVALVTGSTRGIGRAIAEMFAAEGAAVVVAGRSKDAGEEVQQGIEAAGGQALYVATDVGIEEDVKAVVDKCVRHFGKLTVLVNNAAPTDLMMTGLVDGIVTDLTTERWDRIMLGTLTSVFWAMKYSIPEMITAGQGSIVNISSAAAIRGMGGVDAYTAAKAGMIGLSRSVATEYGSRNIRSNTIVLGMVPHGSPDADNPLIPVLGRMQLTRLGRVEDIAYAATYLSSRESGYVTGIEIPVDGGLTCTVKLDVSETLRERHLMCPLLLC